MGRPRDIGAKMGWLVCLCQVWMFGLAFSFDGGTMPPPALNTATGAEAASADVFKCEVCMIVMERKEAQTTRGTCSGLEYYSTVCNDVVTAAGNWMKWINDWQFGSGCFKVTPVGLAAAKPCPAHAICSWVLEKSTGRPFCPPDHTYHSTQHLRA